MKKVVLLSLLSALTVGQNCDNVYEWNCEDSGCNTCPFNARKEVSSKC